MTALFDCYIAVDWSAANQPKRGKDSIWLAALWREEGGTHRLTENIPTRSEAVDRLRGLFEKGFARGHRILAGFDFAFGYPAGAAKALAGKGGWRSLWSLLARLVEDDGRNRSNRFALASELNARIGSPVFWGKPHQHAGRHEHLPVKKAVPGALPERRLVEAVVPSAKSVFQMAYNGAVGSQAMLGIARLEALRAELGARARVWPFETAFEEGLPGSPSVVLAEIYPTLFLREPFEGTKDEAQVRAVVDRCAALDRDGRLGELLAPPPGTAPSDRELMLREEGSILGAGRL